jgi:hypothetical protein
MFDLTQIISLLIQLIFSLFGATLLWAAKTYLFPLLEAKLGKDQMTLLKDYIFTMIRAAEQMAENGEWAELESIRQAKKEYVLNAAKAYCELNGFTFDIAVIDDTIEGLIKTAKSDLK